MVDRKELTRGAKFVFFSVSPEAYVLALHAHMVESRA